MSFTPYCVQNDIDNEIGAAARATLTDDTPPTTLRDAIREASTEIDSRLAMLYDPALMASSDWVTMRARVYASAALFRCRGNPLPGGLSAKLQRYEKELEEVQRGKRQIPDCAPRKACIPVLSNVRTKLDPFPHAVVEQGISTGNPSGYSQNQDITEQGLSYQI